MKLDEWEDARIELVYENDNQVRLNIYDLEPGVTYTLWDGTKLKTADSESTFRMDDRPVIEVVGIDETN